MDGCRCVVADRIAFIVDRRCHRRSLSAAERPRQQHTHSFWTVPRRCRLGVVCRRQQSHGALSKPVRLAVNAVRASVFVVALTGGIAAGKSAAAERFSRINVPVFDADAAARDVVAKGQPALDEIAAEFGADALSANGELDRAAMRARVFADETARRRLEAIVHPRVRRALHQQVDACAPPYCILAIPLFAETRGDYSWVDRIL